jgi:hypothetical protein
MKNYKNILIASLAFLCLGLSVYLPASSQKKYAVQYEYCAVNFTDVPYTVQAQAPLIATANICYIEANGCRNEELKNEMNYAKFLQDFRLDNDSDSRTLAYSKARENALSKAIAKLGNEGWEIISSPTVEFDAYILDTQNNYQVKKGNKNLQPNLFFKRLKQL